MLEKIKNAIFAKYPKTDCRWVFLSAFGQNNEVLVSTWVLYPDKSLDDVLNTIYYWLIDKKPGLQTVVADIVTEVKEISDVAEIQTISVKDYGIAVVENMKSGVLLPNTKWVTDPMQWIQYVKQKNSLSWNAKILTFKTERFVIN